MQNHSHSRLFAVLALALVLGGCATAPREADSDPYSALYEGESTAAFSTSFPASSPAEAEKRGDAAARAGELDRALYEYVRGLKMADEPSADVLYKVGSIHDSRGSAGLARMAYDWALRVEPDHAAANGRLGLLMLRERRYAAAEQRLDPIVAADAPLWWAHNAMGVLRDLQGAFGDALRHYERAHDLNPSSAVVLNNLGYSRYLAGDWDAARDALERALRLDRDYRLAWRNLGLLHVRKGEYEQAVAALERTTSPAAAHNDVGYVSMVEGEYAVAARLFDEARRLSPAYYEAANANARRVEGMLRRSRKTETVTE